MIEAKGSVSYIIEMFLGFTVCIMFVVLHCIYYIFSKSYIFKLGYTSYYE